MSISLHCNHRCVFQLVLLKKLDDDDDDDDDDEFFFLFFSFLNSAFSSPFNVYDECIITSQRVGNYTNWPKK